MTGIVTQSDTPAAATDRDHMDDRVVTRIYASGTWKTESAVHTGGEAADALMGVDMPLLRDPDGKFYLPGSTVADAARAYLAKRLMGADYYRIGKVRPDDQQSKDKKPGEEPRKYEEDPDVSLLFGRKYMSPLVVYHATQVDMPTAIERDGVKIDSKTRLATDEAKFDLEVLPAGTSFAMRFQLVLRANYTETERNSMASLFGAMLQALENGDIRYGARTRKGYGQGRLHDLKIYSLDMYNKGHVQAWLSQGWSKGQQTPLDELHPNQTDARHLFRMEAKLHLRTSVLIRSTGSSPHSPDMVHLKEGRNAILSGTAVGGAFRKRVERIANTMLPETKAAAAVVRLFGPLHHPKDGRGEALNAGRVWFTEKALSGGDHLVQGRVMIDRAFQMPIHGALFDEAPYFPKDEKSENYHCVVDVDLTRYRSDGELEVLRTDQALVAQAFKDLCLGDLAIGGEIAVGRGVFELIKEPGALKLLEKPADKSYGKWEDPEPGHKVWNERLSLPEPPDSAKPSMEAANA